MRPTLRIFFSLSLALLLLLLDSWKAQSQELRYYRFAGRVLSGDTYRQEVRPDLFFALLPRTGGWEIALFSAPDSEDNIARLTPSLHALNPRFIEGWHFRNADNSGPNEPGPKAVEAPGRERGFIFSPEVSKLPETAPYDPTFLARIGESGRGLLRIDNLALGNLAPDERPYIAAMAFTVELVVAWGPELE